MAARGVHAVASHVRSIKRHVPPTFTADWQMLDEAADRLLALQKRAEAAEAEEAAITEANAALQRTVNDQARRLVELRERAAAADAQLRGSGYVPYLDRMDELAKRAEAFEAQRDELLTAIAKFIGAQQHGTLADDLRLLHELHVKYVAERRDPSGLRR